MFLVGGIIFICGFLSILLNRKHILIVLLCLEFMYLGILFCVFFSAGLEWSGLNLIVFMFLIVCEAGLGLSILVSVVYHYGNDSINSIILLKC
uniref:NADH dehydrogenase subunit 4L n=1 Tax=Alectorobius puertoricensis TaxID=48824 RepID=UPI002237BE4C|nr:NADH dehydrogenase subunit 4L [Alectorobius puertoricensis]UYB78544.1 NADH dehydrogenase subunit 4L [Alectorobius puertoricensis]UYB78557.1 NADH dehydrogenase subunit 4L [Alectorobius puertoricensis]